MHVALKQFKVVFAESSQECREVLKELKEIRLYVRLMVIKWMVQKTEWHRNLYGKAPTLNKHDELLQR